MQNNHFSHIYCFAVLFPQRMVKLMFKKQPGIVCTLLDLVNVRIDEFSPQWNMIKCIAVRAIAIIKVSVQDVILGNMLTSLHRSVFPANIQFQWKRYGLSELVSVAN